MKFAAKITVEAESRRKRKNLTMLITEQKDIGPLFGEEWLRSIEYTGTTTEQSRKDNKNANFEKIFKTNRTNKVTEVQKQLKPGHPRVIQKARPIPYHNYVQKSWKKTNPVWTLGEITKCNRGLFCISDNKKTVKKDKSVNNWVHFKKVNR